MKQNDKQAGSCTYNISASIGKQNNDSSGRELSALRYSTAEAFTRRSEQRAAIQVSAQLVCRMRSVEQAVRE